MAVYICPVCKGKGIVPSSFYQLDMDESYERQSSTVINNKTPTQCRSCDGRGVIFDSIEYKPNTIIDDNISDNAILTQYNLNIQETKQMNKPILNDGFLGKVSPD